jgi:N-glycosylase/DNA lyase
MSAPDPWSEWQPLSFLPSLSERTLAELLDGGQAFRWNRQPDEHWLGTWGDCIVQIRRGENDGTQWRAPSKQCARAASALPIYFGRHAGFDALLDALPWRSDAHLALCLKTFPGLRILRQPFGETLLGFLCSATKQIVQIKQMMELLAVRHGALLGLLPAGERTPATLIHRLPTWSELAAVPENQLRECLLGFRARYIHGTAQFLSANPGWLEKTEKLSYAEAKERLCSLPGVGEKVADCVLLFGAGKMEAFPVDVWILKTLERRYGLTGWKPAQVAQFGRAHFGAAAGLAQQFLFAYERGVKKAGTAALDTREDNGQQRSE